MNHWREVICNWISFRSSLPNHLWSPRIRSEGGWGAGPRGESGTLSWQGGGLRAVCHTVMSVYYHYTVRTPRWAAPALPAPADRVSWDIGRHQLSRAPVHRWCLCPGQAGAVISWWVTSGGETRGDPGRARDHWGDIAVSCVCAVLATTHTEKLQKNTSDSIRLWKKNSKTPDSVEKIF